MDKNTGGAAKKEESLKEWLYDYQVEMSARELVVAIICAFGLLFLQSYLNARDAKELANEYKATLAEKQSELDALTGKMDCKFHTDEYIHVWKDACYVGIDGVEVLK